MTDPPSSCQVPSSNENKPTTAAASTPLDRSCAPCVKMLHEILASGAARPQQIVQALSPQLSWRPTPNGLEVQIPSTTAVPQRQWTEIQPMVTEDNNVEEEPQRQLLPVMLQATSAVESNNPSSNNETTTTTAAAPGFEWMQIVCKPCSSRGPEAGARAFVMGPTPLSMVVCSNRLQGSTPAARRAEMEEILTHEFMHVYDVRQYQLDLRACENLAYSEVRAARQAECVNSWTPQTCTRVKAQTATQNLFPSTGAFCIRSVWEKAYADTRPFGGPPAEASRRGTYQQQQPTSSR